MSFSDLDLDKRIVTSLARVDITSPTDVQKTTIPLILEAKSVLIQAKTGSGKTLAYLIPTIQRILTCDRSTRSIRGIVLVPSRELVSQLSEVLDIFAKLIPDLDYVCLTGTESSAVELSLVSSVPEILVCTPTKLASLIKNRSVSLNNSLQAVIIDEADLTVLYSHAPYIKQIVPLVPPTASFVMCSATLEGEVFTLINETLPANYVNVAVDAETKDNTPTQLKICAKDEAEKYLLLFSFIKLNLLKGKLIIFTNNTNSAYKLKLFLEKFAINSSVISPDFPSDSRYHVIQQFNRGHIDYLIAADAANHAFSQDLLLARLKQGDNVEDEEKPKKNNDIEYGVGRGIDFKRVTTVINFDVPSSVEAYIHRVGRTARGVGTRGQAITLYTVNNPGLLPAIEENQIANLGKSLITNFTFKIDQVKQFTYRVTDTLGSLTDKAIRQCRINEILAQVKLDKKLKVIFKEEDIRAIKINNSRKKTHLGHIPDYLAPGAAAKMQASAGLNEVYVPMRKRNNKKNGRKIVAKGSSNGRRK